MKKMLIILLSLLSFSCVSNSLSDPDVSHTGLLIIKSELNKINGGSPYGAYYLTISNEETGDSVRRKIPAKTKLTKIYLEPGKYKVTNVDIVYDNGKVVNTKNLFKDSAIIKDGIIKIYSYKVIYDVDNTGMKSSVKYMSATDYSRTRNEIDDYENRNLWIHNSMGN